MAFDINILSEFGIHDTHDLIVFIFTGAMGYNCFWAMVHSALYIHEERRGGTLEMMFLSPASRMAIVFGRALSGIFLNASIFSVLSMVMLILGGINISSLLKIAVSFAIIVLSSIIWGAFINSFFLISRDTNFLFTICDEPMHLLSGVKIPLNAFPMFLQVPASIFPLTYCLFLVRQLFFDVGVQWAYVLANVVGLCILVIVTKVILWKTEHKNRESGNLQLF